MIRADAMNVYIALPYDLANLHCLDPSGSIVVVCRDRLDFLVHFGCFFCCVHV
jgi:hypothetical protein